MSCTIDEKGVWHVGEMPNSALDPNCLVAALLRIPPSQALPIGQTAIEIIQDPAICPLLLNP